MTRSRILTLTVASLLVLSATLAGTAAATPLSYGTDQLDQTSGGVDDVPDWYVTLDQAEDTSTLRSWASESDSRQVLFTDEQSATAVVRVPESQAMPGLVGQALDRGLAGESYVERVQPNYVHSYTEPVTVENESDVSAPDPNVRQQLAAVKSDGEYEADGVAFDEDAEPTRLDAVRSSVGADQVTGNGTGLTVAVVDTGVNTANGRVFGNGTDGSTLRLLDASKDILNNETVADNGTDAVEDPNGHGTHVASTAVANYTGTTNDGLAPAADLLAVRALDEEGQGSSAEIAEGIRYAERNGADVIVLSLGSPIADEAIHSAIDDVTVDGDVSAVVTAAGNDRQGTRWVASPASNPSDNSIAVAASNTSSNESAEVAYFSNLGNHPGTTDASGGDTLGQAIDVSAPGMEITAKTPDTSGTVSDTTLSGTSMAAPVVAGGLAAGLEERSNLQGDHEAVRETLGDTANPVPKAAVAETGQGQFAADNFASGTNTTDQADAMTGTATARNEFWQALSDGSGGFALRLLN